MLDTKVIEKISPEYWRNTQLSLAKFYGRIRINNTMYILCPVTDHLIREDVWKREQKDEKKRKAVAMAEKKKWEAVAQSGLF